MKERKPHARKRNWFLIIPGLIIVTGLILTAVFFLLDDKSGTVRGNLSEIEVIGGIDLTLLIDETDFITGSTSEAAVTVLYTDAVDAGIFVVDETGRALGEIENDGSGRGETVITVPTEQDGCVRYQAVSGDHASNQVTCYIHPEITAEMVRTLAEVSGDLGEFVTGQDFDDPLGPEALDKVREYLLSDSRVADAWENDGAVLYATTDSLMGSYGLGASDEMSFGGSFAAAEDTYRSYTEGKDVSGETLESSTVLTNTKLLYLSPLPEDRLVEFTKGSFVSKVLDLADAVDGDFSYAERERAWELFETGEFTDAGFLTLVTHGKRLERRDGTYMFCFVMGKLGLEELEEEFGANRLNLGKLWGAYFMDEEAENEEEREYLYANDSYRLLYDYTPNESESSRHLFATTNYLESVLKDRVFDNTIIYFSVCHSAVDEELATLFLTHGAGAYIGSVPALNSTVSYATLSALAEVLGSGGTIGEVKAKALSGAYDTEVLEWYNSTIAEGYRRYREDLIRAEAENIPDEIKDLTMDDVHESRETSEMVYWTRTSLDRRVLGTGILSGTVVDSDGEPIANAEVTIHRWLDHGFVRQAQVTTDDSGSYEAEVPFGIYGITAEKWLNGTTQSGNTTTELEYRMSSAPDIILGCAAITGRVLDAYTLEPVEGASVQYTFGSDISSVPTDADGVFLIEKLAPGFYTLLVTKDGYAQSDKYSLNLEAGTTASLPDDILLERLLVSDAYSYRLEYSNDMVFEYHIPHINLDSTAVSEINRKIWDNYYTADRILISDDQEPTYGMVSPYLLHVSYEWSVNGNVLSLILTERTNPWDHDATYHDYWNLLISTGEPAGNEQIIEAAGYTVEEFYQGVYEALAAYWDDMTEQYAGQINSDAYFASQFQSCIDRTLVYSNIEQATPYIDGDGKLCFIAPTIPWIAGGGVTGYTAALTR